MPRLKHIIKTNIILVSLCLGLMILMMHASTASARTIECANGQIVDIGDSNTQDLNTYCLGYGGVKPGATVQATNQCILDDGVPDPVEQCPGGARPNPCINDDGIPDGVECRPGGSTSTGSGFGEAHTIEKDCNDPNGVNSSNCKIVKHLVNFTNILSGLVGIVIVIMLIVGGIQYSAAGDNPQSTQAAKKRITNAVLALVLFIFSFSIIQWLIPGGVF